MVKYKFFLCVLLFSSTGYLSAQQPDLLKYVNTLQGTHSNWGYSYGNTYPTVGLPFAMHLWSAQTGKNGDGWKYQYEAKSIRGFQQVHQCSPWVGDYAVFSLMPVIGDLVVDEDSRASTFSHDNEIAKPHYYKVKFDNGITSEISPVERGSHMRFSFPDEKDAYLVLDGYTKTSRVKILPNERRIVGWVHNGTFIPGNFKNYFVLEFDQPFTAYGTWENKKGEISQGKTSGEGEGMGAYIQFKEGTKVEVKIASSYISQKQAELSLERELGSHRRLEHTKEAAAEIWNKLLGRVLVEGGTREDRATFYSCLFRANLFSRKFYEIDENGEPWYFSPNDGKVHKGYMYTDNGFWDTFRAQFPLSIILHPTMHGRYMGAILAAQRECGWMPSWSFPGETGGVMIGNHAISLLTDAWAKGLHTFNPDSALNAYVHEVTNNGPGGRFGRDNWKEYFTLGYVPYPEGKVAATSKTLEYAYDDFCAYQLAKMTGNSFYEDVFGRQMYNYRNVFDSTTGFMRGKNLHGEWNADFSPYEWGGPYVEGNAWHYTWSVFHDIQGLINLMGGDKEFIDKIDSVFSAPTTVEVGTYGKVIHEMEEMVKAGMGQYAQGNEPIQHLIYLYNYAGAPWKTQKRVRTVMDQLYNATERGFPGDEDQGQMSSWYVLSALGIYSVTPGTDQYVIGSPLFDKATVTLENGNKFVIVANNNSKENVYIQSATLNGKAYSHNWLTYADIMNGGTLYFEMGSKPAYERGIKNENRPFSLTKPK